MGAMAHPPFENILRLNPKTGKRAREWDGEIKENRPYFYVKEAP